MSSPDRQRRLRTALVGVTIMIGVGLLAAAGLLAPLERWLYDARVRKCQYFMPAPSDDLVLVMIDDPSLEVVGRWPWGRSTVAAMVDVLHDAGAKAIAFDIIFAQPQPPEYRAPVDGEGDGRPVVIDHDQALAAAMSRHGSVIPAGAFAPRLAAMQGAVSETARSILIETPGLGYEETTRRLLVSGAIGSPRAFSREAYSQARRAAVLERVESLVAKRPDVTPEALRSQLFPEMDAALVDTVEAGLIDRALTTATALAALRPYSRAATDAFSGALAGIPDAVPPPILARAAGGIGFVDYLSDADGVVRWTPLWIRHEDRMYPQIGLSLALTHLGVSPGEVSLDGQALEIPLGSGKTRRIALSSARDAETGQSIDQTMRIPWFGPADRWQVMYDFDPPRFEESDRYLSAEYVLRLPRATRKIEANLRTAADALGAAGHLLMSASTLEEFMADLPAGDDLDAWFDRMDRMIKEIEASGLMDLYGAMSDAQLEEELGQIEDAAERSRTEMQLRAFLGAARALPLLRSELEKLERQRRTVAGDLRQSIQGRSVLVGWAAMGSVDFKPTPLHARCPGVLAHAMVFNAVMTGESWRAAPAWIDTLVVLAVGLCATIMAAWLSPLPAASLTTLLGVALAAVNGIVAFDWGNVWSNLSTPLAVLVLVWAGCTVYRFVDEQRERARITRRFRSYVDPALVDYVIAHPRRARLEGQRRELSVVFTDLAGFTTLSEKLRERTVGLLNEYMGEMVPLIRARRGYVNKFLGDGIMFFYGAPMPNNSHAADALATVLAMNEALRDFNERLIARELPCVAMRAGVASGWMIVGDAGPAQSTDYTVLGDVVNLAARLESANKAMGSSLLVNERTRELAGDGFLYRPIGRLQVVGKTEGVMTYEPLAWSDRATPEQRDLAAATTGVVEAYLGGSFERCIEAVAELEARFGVSPLSRLYDARSRTYLDGDRDAPFTGVIELAEK